MSVIGYWYTGLGSAWWLLKLVSDKMTAFTVQTVRSGAVLTHVTVDFIERLAAYYVRPCCL
jgi:hypothetical protein